MNPIGNHDNTPIHRWPSLAITSLALCTLAAAVTSGCSSREATHAAGRDLSLLHVSYDPTRELFQEVNRAFAARYQKQTGDRVEIRMSHGGSGKQARAVIDGLDADIVSLGLAYDVDAIARQGNGLVAANWATRAPHGGVPFYSTIAFVVRRGNPKNIRDWGDLVREGVQVVTPNPKTSGGARWTYLAAYAYAKGLPGGSDASATEFVRKLYANVPVLDSGARGASTTFARNGIGDVLLTWENEAFLLLAEQREAGLELVVPPHDILAEPAVAWVDRNVARHGTADVARAYVEYLYTPEAQELAAKHHYRPQDATVAARFAQSFRTTELFSLRDVFGSWEQAHRAHFADGGTFDRITAERGTAR